MQEALEPLDLRSAAAAARAARRTFSARRCSFDSITGAARAVPRGWRCARPRTRSCRSRSRAGRERLGQGRRRARRCAAGRPGMRAMVSGVRPSGSGSSAGSPARLAAQRIEPGREVPEGPIRPHQRHRRRHGLQVVGRGGGQRPHAGGAAGAPAASMGGALRSRRPAPRRRRGRSRPRRARSAVDRRRKAPDSAPWMTRWS